MTGSVQSWLQGISADSGVLACGLRHPHGQCISRSFTPNFPEAKLDEIWNQLSEAVKMFQLRRITVERLCWKFDRYHLWFALRPDGLGLGLVLKHAPGHGRIRASAILREFLEQDWRLAA